MKPSDSNQTGQGKSAPGDDELPEHAQSAERKSFLELTRQLASLPLDQAAAALETSAAIASISLRAGIEVLARSSCCHTDPAINRIEVMGELGRRLAMGDYDSAVAFLLRALRNFETFRANYTPTSSTCAFVK